MSTGNVGSIAIEAGTLVAVGTCGNDTFTIRRHLTDNVIVTVNALSREFDMDDFFGVHFDGLSGNDTFRMTDPLVSPRTGWVVFAWLGPEFDEPGGGEVVVEHERLGQPAVAHHPKARGVDEGVLALVPATQPAPRVVLLLRRRAVHDR